MVSFTVKFILILLLTPCYMAFPSSSSSSKNGNYHYTHNRQQLNPLYNKRITSIQKDSRPLEMPGGKPLDSIGINHRERVATLNDGQKFLVHKGKDFGKNSQTVVGHRKYKSQNWSPSRQPINADPGKAPVRLDDLVKSGGSHYNALCSNCMYGSEKMRERFQDEK